MREKSTVRAFTRGGVPVLNRRMRSPSALQHSASGPAAAKPSGPESRNTSPTIVRPCRYVPVASTAARQRYTAPFAVTTALTRPPSVSTATTSACLTRRFGCSSSVCFITA